MTIDKCIEVLPGLNCWSVVAGPGTGSVVHLGFGEKILRTKPLKNTKLSDEQRNFEPETSLMIHCSWRVSRSKKVICGWRDSNELDGDMLNGLLLLKDRSIIDVRFTNVAYDLDVYFDNDILLQLFCDQTNDDEADENYSLFTKGKIFTVDLNGVLSEEAS